MQKVAINLLLLFSILAVSCASSEPLATKIDRTEETIQPTATSQQSLDPTPIPTNTASPVSTETSSKDPVDNNEVTEEINESTYDPNCMVKVLGRSRTDDIVYFNSKIDQQELLSVQHCKLGKPEM